MLSLQTFLGLVATQGRPFFTLVYNSHCEIQVHLGPMITWAYFCYSDRDHKRKRAI
jgi:hypothetical protein